MTDSVLALIERGGGGVRGSWGLVIYLRRDLNGIGFPTRLLVTCCLGVSQCLCCLRRIMPFLLRCGSGAAGEVVHKSVDVLDTPRRWE
jgi:hypothetical protein